MTASSLQHGQPCYVRERPRTCQRREGEAGAPPSTQVYDFNVPTFGPGVVFDVEQRIRTEQFRMFTDALKKERLKSYVPQFVQEAEVRAGGTCVPYSPASPAPRAQPLTHTRSMKHQAYSRCARALLDMAFMQQPLQYSGCHRCHPHHHRPEVIGPGP